MPLKALRGGYPQGIVDGYIFYLNPLQRFASNELWDDWSSATSRWSPCAPSPAATCTACAMCPGRPGRSTCKSGRWRWRPSSSAPASPAGPSSACASRTASRRCAPRWAPPAARRTCRNSCAPATEIQPAARRHRRRDRPTAVPLVGRDRYPRRTLDDVNFCPQARIHLYRRVASPAPIRRMPLLDRLYVARRASSGSTPLMVDGAPF